MPQRALPPWRPATGADLSVIVPTLNEAVCLPKLLESLRRQTQPPLEIIVADAGSTDRTVVLAEAAGARVVVGGLPAVGRNAGAAAARGSYLLFLDADVVLPPTFIAQILETFDRDYLEIATTGLVPDSTLRIDHLAFAFQQRAMELLGELYPFTHGAVILVTARLHRRLGGFRTTLRLGEDTDYGRRAKQFARFGVIPGIAATMSVRRFTKEGRLTLLRKYLRHGLLQRLEAFGVRADVPYDFGQFDTVTDLSQLEELIEQFLRLFPEPKRPPQPEGE